MFRHDPHWLRRTSFPDEFSCGKNNKSYRRTSRKVEGRCCRRMECARSNPASHRWLKVFLIYCIACACCGLRKRRARTLLGQSIGRVAVVVMGRSDLCPLADDSKAPSCDRNRKRKDDSWVPPRRDKFFHYDSEPLTDEIYRGCPRRYQPWVPVPHSFAQNPMEKSQATRRVRVLASRS